MRLQIFCFLYFSNFIFNENHVFNEEGNPSSKVVMVVIDDIANLEDLTRLTSISEKCGNFKVVNGGGELTRNINQKKK